MSFYHRRQFFGPSCPSGGIWYACNSGSNFVGCCDGEPCSQGCADGSLEPASFDNAFIGKFPNQQCPNGGNWYTCADTTPPFMGCCKSNPCAQGNCPVGDLTAGSLSSDPKIAAPFLSSGSSPTQTIPSTAANSASASSAANPSASSSAITASTSAGHKSNAGAIAGGVVGGIAIVAIAIVALIVYRLKTKKVSSSSGIGRSEITSSDLETKEKNDSVLPYSSPTPAYSPGEHTRQNPSAYPVISELDSPRTQQQNLHETSHSLAELPAAQSTSTYRPYRRPESSTNGLGIATPPPSHASQFNDTFPSPLNTASESFTDTDYNRRSELSAADSVRVSRN